MAYREDSGNVAGYADYYSGGSGAPGHTEGDAGPSEQDLIAQGKRIHRTTTDSAARAAQTALRTKEIADNTLVELQGQGQRLKVINADLHEIDADVKEAKGILAYMRRCCLCFLFSCCCDCDPSKKADETRQQRVEMRKQMRARELEMYANAQPKQYQHRAAEEEINNQVAMANSKAGKAQPGSEAAQRSQLLGESDESAAAQASRRRAWQVGEHLEGSFMRELAEDAPAEASDKDRLELQAETDKQDKYLDIVGDALGDLTRAARDMNEELESQDKQLEDLQGHAETTLNNINEVEATTRRDFKLREAEAAKRQRTRQKFTPNVGKLASAGMGAKGAVSGAAPSKP